MSIKLFIDLDSTHDATGVSDPALHYWTRSNGIYYPDTKIERDELEEEISIWLKSIRVNIEHSLLETSSLMFNAIHMKKRSFFIYLLNKIS